MTPLRIILFAVAALLFGLRGAAYADGTVLRATGCGGKVFAGDDNGYAVLDAGQSDIAKDGDKLVGDFDHIGFRSFTVGDDGRQFSARVNERGLTKAEITARIAASCRTATSGTQTSGYVERIDGCGGKAFVSTTQGYAVIERLSGGIIATGDTLSGELNRYGRATVTNPQTGASFVVFVDDFALPKSAEARKVAESCHDRGPG
jgi:hypothetical protein